MGGIGLQAEEREWNSGGGLGKMGWSTGSTPVFIKKGCVGFNLVGWEKVGPKWTGYVTGFSIRLDLDLVLCLIGSGWFFS